MWPGSAPGRSGLVPPGPPRDPSDLVPAPAVGAVGRATCRTTTPTARGTDSTWHHPPPAPAGGARRRGETHLRGLRRHAAHLRVAENPHRARRGWLGGGGEDRGG